MMAVLCSECGRIRWGPGCLWYLISWKDAGCDPWWLRLLLLQRL